MNNDRTTRINITHQSPIPVAALQAWDGGLRPHELSVPFQKRKFDMTRSWYVYPARSRPSFPPKCRVFVRSKTAKSPGKRGFVVSASEDRRLIRFDGCGGSKDIDNRAECDAKGNHPETDASPVKTESTRSFRISRLLPLYDNQGGGSLVILTATTTDFRLISMSQVTVGDKVLEIGSSFGEGSSVIARHAGYLVGFDLSAKAIAAAKERCVTSIDQKRAEFHHINVFADTEKSIELALTGSACQQEGHVPRQPPSVVCIDIGGDRDLWSVVRMVRWADEAFHPRLIVVKSEELAWTATGRNEIRQLKTETMRRRKRKLRRRGSDHIEEDQSSDVWELSNSNVTPLPVSEQPLIQNDGLITNGEQWWNQLCSGLTKPTYSHPLQAPLTVGSDGVAICRYFNYHKDGCKKGIECTFNHSLCHFCSRAGHRAMECDIHVSL